MSNGSRGTMGETSPMACELSADYDGPSRKPSMLVISFGLEDFAAPVEPRFIEWMTVGVTHIFRELGAFGGISGNDVARIFERASSSIELSVSAI